MVDGSLRYKDSFAAGWHLHSSGYDRKFIGKRQAEANAFLGVKEQQGVTTGLVDGWDAREAEVRKAKA